MANEIGEVHGAMDKILAEFDDLWYTKNQMSDGKGLSGKPDYTILYNGVHLGVECKWDLLLKDGSITTSKGKLPNPNQCSELKDIEKAGGIALVVDRNTVQLVREYLNSVGVIQTPYLVRSALEDGTHWSLFETKLKEVTI